MESSFEDSQDKNLNNNANKNSTKPVNREKELLGGAKGKRKVNDQKKKKKGEKNK